MSLEIIILAAGKGTRMRSALPKVLHQVGGRPMLQHVVEASLVLDPVAVHIVTGFGGEQVKQSLITALPDAAEKFNWAEQSEQKGTGHAVAQAAPAVADESMCLILFGDVPLVDIESLERLCQSTSELSVLTATPQNTQGLGRIVRNENNQVVGIVEHKDASAEQLAIGEINTGIKLCKGKSLKNWLANLDNNNAQGEFYLTDIVANAVHDGVSVHAEIAADPELLLGINSRSDLAVAERMWHKLQANELMAEGVTLLDPGRFDLRGTASFGQDCMIDVNVILEGNVRVGNNVHIGPNCIIRNSQIGDHTNILANSIVEDAELGKRCNIGPYARLRPESRLADDVRIGNFVEVKKSRFGAGSKANHLAYVGDSEVGKNVNIGAGVITCNYDGANKHQTIIGDDVFVGSDTQLVAPVTVGDGATIGAGSTITRNVDAGDLAISRSKQKSISDWQRPVKK